MGGRKNYTGGTKKFSKIAAFKLEHIFLEVSRISQKQPEF
jgi:hypothetical protein